MIYQAHMGYRWLNTLCLQKFPVSIMFKMAEMIERLAGPTIGFSCYDYFVVARETFYDVSFPFNFMISCSSIMVTFVKNITRIVFDARFASARTLFSLLLLLCAILKLIGNDCFFFRLPVSSCR